MPQMIEDLIKVLEKQMIAQLEELRVTFGHPGNKGTSTEELLRQFLRKYLPRRLGVGEGEIIDLNCNRTGQCDLVIVNEDHPFTWTPNKPGLFFVEGVCAVGEVKTVLTSTELTSSLKNSVKHKKLKVTHAKGNRIHASPSDRERFYSSPPSFLFAFESQLSMETIFKKVKKFKKEENVNDYEILDAIFVLNKGCMQDCGDGKEAFKMISPEGKALNSWVWNPSENTLNGPIDMALIVMPKVLRYEPIITRYIMKNIK